MPEASVMEGVTVFVALLVSLSVASERLVEIVKGLFPFLDQKHEDATREGFRRAGLQLLAVIAGVVTAFLARPALNQYLPQGFQEHSTPTFLALGFLTSGGSGLWNGVLGYVKNVKDIKKAEAMEALEASGTRAAERKPAKTHG